MIDNVTIDNITNGIIELPIINNSPTEPISDVTSKPEATKNNACEKFTRFNTENCNVRPIAIRYRIDPNTNPLKTVGSSPESIVNDKPTN
jgi:hypothetical protein